MKAPNLSDNKMARIYQDPLLKEHHLLRHKMVNHSIVDVGLFLYYTGFDTQIAVIYEEKRALYPRQKNHVL